MWSLIFEMLIRLDIVDRSLVKLFVFDYHNKGFSDSIAARKPIIELRKKLKKFDVEE